MSQQPLVSIVVPVYNCTDYLPACLDSIRAQTYQNWEAILVDDGSTDGSGALCDRAAQADPRFRVIHKENGGVSTARNAGIDAAKGTFLMFVDSDDLIRSVCVQTLIDGEEAFGSDLVVCSFTRFDEEKENPYQITPFYAVLFRDVRDFLLVYTASKTNMFGVSIWAKLFKTDLLNEHHIRFDPSVSYEEDCLFVTDYLDHARTFVGLGAPLYRYRQQEVSLSKGYRKDAMHFLINGYHRRCDMLRKYGLTEDLPLLKNVFFSVVKNTCIKILNANLGRKERLAEYAKLMAYPEVQEAVIFDRISESGFNNRICNAIVAKKPARLDRLMRIWRLADRAVAFKHSAAKAAREAAYKEKK